MTTLPLTSYFPAESADTNKRDRSEDTSSSSTCSPASKKTIVDSGDDDVFAVPDEAPVWAAKLFKSIEAVSVKLDDKLNNLSRKVDEISSNFASYKSQINADIMEFKNGVSEQIASMEKCVDFVSKNFDTQVELNVSIQNQLDELKNGQREAAERHANEIDSLEQYSRRNCLVLHGVKEKENEDTDDLFIKTVKKHLGIEVKIRDLDRSHRIGPKRTDGSGRPIIIKFARYLVRANVFREKRKLKNTGLLISESLTKKRVALLNEARDKYGKTNVWSSDGEIIVLKDNQKTNVRNL